jgi:hypothetical protein
MIDPSSEETFPLKHINRHTSLRKNVSTYFRWVTRGVRGVRLETVKVGGATHTSKAAIQRFFRTLTEHRYGVHQPRQVSDADHQVRVAQELERRYRL